jgi:hypothetical protein
MDFKDFLTMLALLGTGGAIGSWLSLWSRNRRDDRVRWHSERRSAYERFLTRAEKMYDTEMLIAVHIGNLRQLTGWGNDPLFDEEYLLRQAEKLNEDLAAYAIEKVRQQRPIANAAQEQMHDALAAMEMISYPRVVDAARSHRDALRSLVAIAFEYPPRECGGASEPLVQASELVAETRVAFITVTRKELGVE